MPDIKEKLVELIHHCTSCEECFDTDIADHLIANGVTIQQDQFREVTKMVTNADRIRAMSDKELAHWINLNAYNDFAYEHCCDAEWRKKPCNNKCVACLVAWLQQPAEEVDHG